MNSFMRRVDKFCIKLIKLLLRIHPDHREILKKSDGREVLYALHPASQDTLLRILIRKDSEVKLSDLSETELDRLVEQRALEALYNKS